MKPKSEAKQTKWNLVSPMSCYDKFIFTFGQNSTLGLNATKKFKNSLI